MRKNRPRQKATPKISNATIEAARAGDAGKGFAVVANEIKELSRQTAKATLEIKERVSGIQISTDESVAEIVKISSVISNINDLVSTIVGSIEEQADATKEISENITQASRGIDEVNENVTESSSVAEKIAKAIANVNQSVGEISSSSSLVDTSATELSNLADKLKTMVSKFKT